MNLDENKVALERNNYKYLFLASYFNLADTGLLSTSSKPFIREYLYNNFDNIDDASLLGYLDYLDLIGLNNVLLDRDVNMFKYIKPQFRFVCTKKNVEILKFDQRVYIKPDTPVYATNFFVKNPSEFKFLLYNVFSNVIDKRNFVNNDKNYCLIQGNTGYVFDQAYVDWCGVRMCEVPKIELESSPFPYRLYLVGDAMARHFATNNISFDSGNFILKNFYKGLPMFRTNYKIINSKKFTTKKPNHLFNEFKQEFDTKSVYVKFIQRDYIYDAKAYPDDLLDLLNEHMTYTSVYKFVTKFMENGEEPGNYYSEIVIDRYAVDKYQKLSIKIDETTMFPTLRYNDPSYIFIRPDLIQIKGTLNAFYVPKHKLFAILANNSLFGSTTLLEFDRKLIPYRQYQPPYRLNDETYVVDKKQKLYLTKYTFANTIPAYLLIRGDYESSSEIKTLRDLKPWVQNTLLKLLIAAPPSK